MVFLNKDSPHGVHAVVPGPEYPALHKQILLFVPITPEFSGQPQHGALPLSALALPATHARHASPLSAFEYPGRQLQFLKPAL